MLTTSSQGSRLKVIINSICNYWRTMQVYRINMFCWVDSLIDGGAIYVLEKYGTLNTLKLQWVSEIIDMGIFVVNIENKCGWCQLPLWATLHLFGGIEYKEDANVFSKFGDLIPSYICSFLKLFYMLSPPLHNSKCFVSV